MEKAPLPLGHCHCHPSLYFLHLCREKMSELQLQSKGTKIKKLITNLTNLPAQEFAPSKIYRGNSNWVSQVIHSCIAVPFLYSGISIILFSKNYSSAFPLRNISANHRLRNTIHSLHHSIRVHVLPTVPYKFCKALTRRICLTIKSFFIWWSFPSLLWSECLIQGWYCKEKLDASLSLGVKELSA